MITYGHHLPAFVKGIVSVLSYTLPPDNPPSDPEAGELSDVSATATLERPRALGSTRRRCPKGSV